jgi:aminopeptidase N
MLLLCADAQDFVFEDVPSRPAPSLLRGFSAPVKLAGLPRATLPFLATYDADPFVRWDAGQQYATALILDMVAAWRRSEALALDVGLADALAATLAEADADPAFAAEALILPLESILADQMDVADPEAIHAVRGFLRTEIGRRLGAALRETYDKLDDTGPYRIDGPAIGRRSLRNTCLAYLAAAGADGVRLARAQFDARRNMTDVLAALSLLAETDTPDRAEALAAFYAEWRGDPLVLDKWFAIQAGAPAPETLAEVRALYRHPDFDLRNPNRVFALAGSFSANHVRFHDASGQGYAFLADVILALDPVNGQTAARLVNPLGRWRRQDAARGALMRAELERILAVPNLGRGTYEKASKGLA